MTPKHPLPRLLVAVSLALLSACGNSKPPPPTPITAETFPAEYAQALCTREQQCLQLAPYLIDQCKANAATLIGTTDVKKAVDAGRLVYDQDKARQCIDGIAATRCAQVLQDFIMLNDDVQASCYAALQGTVQKSGTCSFSFECASGSCGLSDQGTCPGTCPAEVLGEGETCSRIRPGSPQCDDRAGLRCSGGTCVKPAGQDASCLDNAGCKSGFICVESKCVPLAKEGSGCSEDASCAEGLFCTGDNVCAPRVAEGKPCAYAPDNVDAALRGAACLDGLTCKGGGLDNQGNPIPGTCTKVAAEGGACQAPPADAQLTLSGCQAGLACVNGTCTAPPVSGPCPDATNLSGCRPGVAFCDSSTTTCQLLRNVGAPCDNYLQCASNNCGPDNTCAAPNVSYCHE
ncbi:MAG: hypothetical protein ACXU86_00690 [Archangium sp.]